MSLKKKIKVGYTDIKIDLVKEIPDKNQHVFGEYDPVSQKILLDKNQSERSLANSFLHELVHAVVDNSGLNSDGNCLSSTRMRSLQLMQSLINCLKLLETISGSYPTYKRT